ncbi:MAG: YfhO family protein [Chloroflexi bacterium]|nr:YfhO family protein [Chloroflexota bacterium]
MERIVQFFRQRDLQALLLLAALVFLFLLPAATMQGVYFYGDANDYFARLAYSAERLRTGQFALWNPYLSLGGSHLADPAALATYLPALALFLIFPEPFAYNYTVILHLYLAASGAYLLARAWQQSRGGALLAATVFAFSGFSVGHLQHLNIIIGAAWLPWIFWCLEKFFATRRNLYLALGSSALALQMTGGHTQTVLYGGAAWGAYCVVFFVREWRMGQMRVVVRQSVSLALMLLGVFGLAAIFIAPLAELLNFTARGDRITYEYATTFSLEPLRLVEFFYPYFFGGNPGSVERGAGSLIEMTAYLGIVPLALAIGALWRRAWRIYFLLGLGALALVLALGKFTPLYWLVYRLPLFGTVRAPARFLELVVFAVALLAGYGLDEIKNPKTKLLRNFVFGFLGLLLGLEILFFLAPRVGVNLSETFAQAAANPALLATMLFTLAAGALFVLWWRDIFTPRARVVLTLTLVLIDLFYFGWNFRYNAVAPFEVYTEPDKNTAALRQVPNALAYYWGLGETKGATYLQRGELDTYVDAARAGLRQSLPIRFHVRSMQGYGTEPPVYQDLMQAVERGRAFDQNAVALTAWFGDTHVLSAQALHDGKLERVQRSAQINLYQNTLGAHIGRARVVWDAIQVESPDAALASVTSGIPNPGQVRLQGELGNYAPVQDAQASAQIEMDHPEHVSVRVETNQPGWLVLNDTYYPGWRATVDGQPAEILRANALVRAVAIPAGEHRVEFVYEPLSVKIGALVSLVTLILLAGVLSFEIWRKSTGVEK